MAEHEPIRKGSSSLESVGERLPVGRVARQLATLHKPTYSCIEVKVSATAFGISL